MLHRACRAGDLGSLTNHEGKPSGGLMGFMKSLHGELIRHNAKKCVVVFDGGISKRRREMYPPYKGHRGRSKDDPHYEEESDPVKRAEKEAYRKAFSYQRASISLLLSKLRVPVVKVPGWEADDLIFRIARFRAHSVPGNTIVLSDDEDYYQMIHKWQEPDGEEDPLNFNVMLYRPMKSEMVTTANVDLILGFPHAQHILRRSGIGDSSDKIKGIKGVGYETMDLALLGYSGSIDYPFEDFIFYCSNHYSKRVRKIADEFEIIHRNYELMQLEWEQYTDETRKIVADQLRTRDSNLHEAKEFLTNMDIFSIVKDFHQWVVPFQRLS